MDQIYDLIVDMICEFARICIVVYYCNLFFEKKSSKIIRLCTLAVSYAAAVGTYYLFHNVWLNFIMSYLAIVAIIFLYHGTVRKKTVMSAALLSAEIMMDVIATFIMTKNPDGQNHEVVSSFMSVFLFFLSVIIVKKIQEHGREEIEDRHWIYLIMLSGISICCMMTLVYDSSVSQLSIIALSTALLLVNMGIYYLNDAMAEQCMLAIENERLKSQVNAYEMQIRSNLDRERATSVLRHDMKHHIREIQSIAEAGGDKKVADYTSQMLKSLESEKIFVDSKNVAIDGVMNYMCGLAAKKGIKVETKVVIPEDMELNSYDFNIIISNIMENAIEASEKTEDPFIEMNIEYKKDCIFIKSKNNYIGEILTDEKGNIISSKGKGHGIGLKSINMTAEKYNGGICIEYENGIFQIWASMSPPENILMR